MPGKGVFLLVCVIFLIAAGSASSDLNSSPSSSKDEVTSSLQIDPVPNSTTITPVPSPAAGNEGPQVAPLNPEFVEYLQSQASFMSMTDTMEKDRQILGYLPSPVNRSSSGAQALKSSGNQVLSSPASYDLRDLDRVTPIRDQGNCGSCWAFATYGSTESVLKPAENLDLSENNLKNSHGFDFEPCSGGNFDMSTAYLARWNGPILESADPYSIYSSSSPVGLSPTKHVQNVLYLTGRINSADNDGIKNAIITYGGVSTSFYWDPAYYSTDDQNYYYSGAARDNHAVTIIGWDDNRVVSGSPGTGAFLVKNSWGTDFGTGGYFWVSYYDSKFGRSYPNTVFLTESSNTYDYIYQYDPLGWVSSVGYSSTTAWAANVFTSARSEELRAVGFYAYSPGTGYQIYVYKNPTNGPTSPQGPVSSATGTIPAAGYRTIPLSTPVSLSPGEKFSVVVTLTTPGWNYPIPLEYPLARYSSSAVAREGQSYISPDGESWQDASLWYANTNVCLKAYTRNVNPSIYKPITGNWDDDGKDEIGLFRPSIPRWYLDYDSNGLSDYKVYWGASTDIPITGDWDNDGYDEIGLWRPSTARWYLDYDNNGLSDYKVYWGASTDIPITGDWDNDGYDEIGLFRPSTTRWYLDYDNNGLSDYRVYWGAPTDTPVTGDWDNDGYDEIGLFRPSTARWYLDYDNNGLSDYKVYWGASTDIPITGDWDNDGYDEIGLFRPSTSKWYLDYDNTGQKVYQVIWG